jgi:uncharacterized protein GlcG (DUF336 family)
VPTTYETVTLDDAKQMLSAAEAKADSLGIAYNLAVVDAGGRLVAFVRQDTSPIGCIDLAIGKAMTALIFNVPTSELAALAQSGGPYFGIQESNDGRVVILTGGLPIRNAGRVMGAVGASAGTGEQDVAVAQAAISSIRD